MCSTKWLMPFRRRPSWLLPVRTKTLTLTLSQVRQARSATMRTPLPRRTTVVSGSLAVTFAVAICIAAIIAAASMRQSARWPCRRSVKPWFEA